MQIFNMPLMQGQFYTCQGVQQIAKETIIFLKTAIQEGMSEFNIVNLANNYMRSRGIESFWYHGVGSLVLIGDRTSLSVSGLSYQPSHSSVVGAEDLVSVDLSPEINGCWGDFARTLVIENGRVANKVRTSSSKKVREMFEGIEAEKKLHERLESVALSVGTFGELYQDMNETIEEMGYKNLDFRENLGHTIERRIDDRRFIEENSEVEIGTRLFTFEPHIGRSGSILGFKREDIYYFSKGKLKRL